MNFNETDQETPAGNARSVIEGRLENGLDIVVIPDRRSQITTHMIWYRNGSSDDPVGKSGIAHFLEHLMFKGTAKNPAGTFSARLADVGREENAFTSNDFTAYHQRVPKSHLSACMEYEADRMKNLVLSDEIVRPERDVVLEERRMRIENSPQQILNEALQTTLFTTHPYGNPVIGWQNEIEDLGRDDAIDYYRRFYTPENAILIVAGAVDFASVRDLAAAHYGTIQPAGKLRSRNRAKEPPQKTLRRVSLVDPKVEQPSFQRRHAVPSYATAPVGVAEALEVLSTLLGGGRTSILTRTLVNNDRVAVGASAAYNGTALDQSQFSIHVTPRAGVALESLDQAVEAVIVRFSKKGFDTADVERAKTNLIAEATYARDSQMSLATWYGVSLTTGMTTYDIAAWPDRINAVTAGDLRQAMGYLSLRHGVIGYLDKE